MVLRKVASSVLGLLLILQAAAGDAARVTPMDVELTPSGRNSVARIEVTNGENRDLPVEIRMYQGAISEDGKLTLQPADDKFVAFPPQVVIPANGQQVFRVQYIPSGPMTQSELYYASISQLPVALKPTTSRVEVLMRFNVLVNVVPDGTKPDPKIAAIRVTDREIESVKAGPDAGGASTPALVTANGIEVRIQNEGNRLYAAGRSAWTVRGTDATGAAYSKKFTPAEMGDAIGMGAVAPGRTRVFFLPLERRLRDGTVSVSLAR